jgi:hypothetical protein
LRHFKHAVGAPWTNHPGSFHVKGIRVGRRAALPTQSNGEECA